MQPGRRGLPNQNESPDLWSLEQSLPQWPGLILPSLSSSQPQPVAWGGPHVQTGGYWWDQSNANAPCAASAGGADASSRCRTDLRSAFL